MSSSSGQAGKSSSHNPRPNPPPPSEWNNLLRHSSPLGIVKSDMVTSVYNSPISKMHGIEISSSPSAPLKFSRPNVLAQGALHDPCVVRTAHNADRLFIFIDNIVHAFGPFGPLASGFYIFHHKTGVPAFLSQRPTFFKLPATPSRMRRDSEKEKARRTGEAISVGDMS